MSDRNRVVYEQVAESWDALRGNELIEKAWLERLAAAVSPGARVLDLGCGTGSPIAGFFVAAGCDLVGVDFSPAMIAVARKNFPDAEWHVADLSLIHI